MGQHGEHTLICCVVLQSVEALKKTFMLFWITMIHGRAASRRAKTHHMLRGFQGSKPCASTLMFLRVMRAPRAQRLVCLRLFCYCYRYGYCKVMRRKPPVIFGVVILYPAEQGIRSPLSCAVKNPGFWHPSRPGGKKMTFFPSWAASFWHFFEVNFQYGF